MNILKYLLIACSCLIGAAHAQSPIAKDTIEYRAQVWVDKTDLERYGGEEDFKKNLKKMFHNTTRFWNESPNKFNHYFRFVPAEELYVLRNKHDQVRYKYEHCNLYCLMNDKCVYQISYLRQYEC